MASQQQLPNTESSTGAGSSLSSQSSPWGKWQRGNEMRHYSLEVVQHPIRARMCGFGDKDRRPLAPAAIAKMIVRNEEQQVLDVDDVEIDFFLVTCDLWSADGQMEVNLVRNPSSLAATRRRNRENPTGQSSDDGGDYAPIVPSRSSAREEPQGGPARQGTAQSMSPPDASNASWSQGNYQQQQQPWGAAPPTLPSINSLVPEPNARPWPQQPQPQPQPQPQYGYGDVYAVPTGAGGSQGWTPEAGDAGSPMYGGPTYPGPGQPTPMPHVMQVPSSRTEKDRDNANNYTRTLVGPLTANAARLYDDKKQPGIFFTFQDLSVRTEGTFRLRLRLVNVGAPPAPNRGATRVHEDVSPVLAQTLTEPFTVYSAKKFPGVPAMTALSLEFGKQGQKLPLRNRPGSGVKTKTRGGESEVDEGSGAESEGE